MVEEHKKEEHHEHHHEKKSSFKEFTEKIKKLDKWQKISIALTVLLIVSIFTNGFGISFRSKNAIADKAVNYINSYLIKSGSTATLKSVEEINLPFSDFYQVTVDISGKEASVLVTKDGKYLDMQGDLITLSKKPQLSNQTTSTQTQKEIPKTDKPVVDLYVMGFCPYGNKAEDTMLPVYNLLKSKVSWNIHYIVSVSGSTVNSLHGPIEVIEDEREACILKNYGTDKWFSFATYVNDKCGSDGSCWEAAASSSGIDKNKINSCVSSDGLDLMKAEEAASNAAGASGSPTMIINGVETTAVYQYGNSQAYLDAICSAFTTAPSECSQALSGSSATSAGGGSCG